MSELFISNRKNGIVLIIPVILGITGVLIIVSSFNQIGYNESNYIPIIVIFPVLIIFVIFFIVICSLTSNSRESIEKYQFQTSQLDYSRSTNRSNPYERNKNESQIQIVEKKLHKFSYYCPNCGQVLNSVNINYCMNCGYQLNHNNLSKPEDKIISTKERKTPSQESKKNMFSKNIEDQITKIKSKLGERLYILQEHPNNQTEKKRDLREIAKFCPFCGCKLENNNICPFCGSFLH